jgi:hypothetical protein
VHTRCIRCVSPVVRLGIKCVGGDPSTSKTFVFPHRLPLSDNECNSIAAFLLGHSRRFIPRCLPCFVPCQRNGGSRIAESMPGRIGSATVYAPCLYYTNPEDRSFFVLGLDGGRSSAMTPRRIEMLDRHRSPAKNVRHSDGREIHRAQPVLSVARATNPASFLSTTVKYYALCDASNSSHTEPSVSVTTDSIRPYSQS